MIAYSFHPEASAEFGEASAYYEARLSGLGTTFLDAVERTIDLIRQYPDAGAPLGRSRRRVLVQGFPYVVVYLRDPDQVRIVAVAHVRRRPRYWAMRD